jgi:hypothetical protein
VDESATGSANLWSGPCRPFDYLLTEPSLRPNGPHGDLASEASRAALRWSLNLDALRAWRDGNVSDWIETVRVRWFIAC